VSLFLLNILLAVAWSALTGNFTPNSLLFGFGLAFVILWVGFRRSESSRYFTRVVHAIDFVVFFIGALIAANIRMAKTVLSPKLVLRPAVIGIPIDLSSDAAITILMNLITLTPGTLSLDVSSDRKMLFVHGLWVEDPNKFRRDIKQGFERRVKELFD
jgi:multicomponent Na+:H+ antiporter subunit E